MKAVEPDEALIARNMIEVHGAEAATIARDSARRSALAGQPVRAKSWIRVLSSIQRCQNDKASSSREVGQADPLLPASNTSRG